jgi:1-acyl-sn-glycerol-3-phosphate acyltransferase
MSRKIIDENPLSKQYPYPRFRLRRGILKFGIGFFTHILTLINIIGKENIPSEGPLIVVINHFHFLDAAILILAMPWPLEFLADFKMPNVPLSLKIFPALYKTFDVAQGTANLDAMHASEAVLAQNGVLGIFPEGRVHPAPLKPALPGAAFLALRTGAPILPVGIYSDNEWDVFGTIKTHHKRLQVICKVGKVFGPLSSENPRRPSRKEINHAGDEIMRAIAACLPTAM